MIAGAAASVRDAEVLAADAANGSLILQTRGMSRLFFWMSQTVGAAGCLAVPQYTVSDVIGALVPAPEWLNLNGGVIVNPVAAVPTVLNFTCPAKLIRILFTRPAGQATTVQYVLGCSV